MSILTAATMYEVEARLRTEGSPDQIMVDLKRVYDPDMVVLTARKHLPDGRKIEGRRHISGVQLRASAFPPQDLIWREWVRLRREILTQEQEEDRSDPFVTTVHEALHYNYYINSINPPKEEVPTMSDFNAHTVYLTADQETRARSGEMKRKEALDVLTEGFLPEIVLVPGDVVTYEDGRKNSYEIVRIEGGTVLTRRLVANSAGPAGEVAEAKLSDIVAAVRDGRSTINPEVTA